jgi:carbon monoxide dehydrogenase subunit G
MAVLRFAVVVVIAALGSGCINSTSLVKVKPDGSGTIEQTLLVNMAAVKGLLGGLGGAQAKQSSSVLNEEEFKRTAERMGVRPVSLTPMKEGGFEGAKAIYAFDDISKIRVDQDPQMSGSSGGGRAASTANNPIRFALVKQGGNSVLTITVDEKVAASATAKAGDAPSLESIDPTMMAMIKTMFQGFKVLIDLEVEGQIVKTNADYVNGSRITLVELDIAGIFEDEAKLRALQSKVRPGVTISELRPYLKDIKGVKINHPSLTIEYR